MNLLWRFWFKFEMSRALPSIFYCSVIIQKVTWLHITFYWYSTCCCCGSDSSLILAKAAILSARSCLCSWHFISILQQRSSPPSRTWCTMGNQVDEYLCYEPRDLPLYISPHGCNQARQFSASNFLLCFGAIWHKNLLHSQLFVQRSVHQQKYHRHPEQVLPRRT